MEFEFDNNKSRDNKRKHGIDFIEAQTLWDDSERLEIPAKTRDEPRLLLIGKRNGQHWSAVITFRNKKTRIISVRRSRKLSGLLSLTILEKVFLAFSVQKTKYPPRRSRRKTKETI